MDSNKSPVGYLPMWAFKSLVAAHNSINVFIRRTTLPVPVQTELVKKTVAHRDELLNLYSAEFPGFERELWFTYVQGGCTDKDKAVYELEKYLGHHD
jgi:hypothetical protein